MKTHIQFRRYGKKAYKSFGIKDQRRTVLNNIKIDCNVYNERQTNGQKKIGIIEVKYRISLLSQYVKTEDALGKEKYAGFC